MCHFSAAGQYVIELVYYECVASADIELYWAKGAFADNSDTTTWQLVAGVAPPRLECRLTGPDQGGQLTLEWDASIQGMILERASSLSPPVRWVTVPGVVGNSVTIPLTETAGFYRLRQ